MMHRDQRYWIEKAEMMMEDYHHIYKLMDEKKLQEFLGIVGRQAEKYYRHMLTAEEKTNSMSEMTAREHAEELIKEMLNKKEGELSGKIYDDFTGEEITEEDIELVDDFLATADEEESEGEDRVDFSKRSETYEYFKGLSREIEGIKIKSIFTLTETPDWREYKGKRIYSSESELYVLFENGNCFVIDYPFIDSLDVRFRKITSYEEQWYNNIAIKDVFNLTTDIYDSATNELIKTDVISLQYGSIEKIYLRPVSRKYTKWIGKDICFVSPEEDTFGEMYFVMDSGKAFVVSADEAEVDGQIIFWKDDNPQKTLDYITCDEKKTNKNFEDKIEFPRGLFQRGVNNADKFMTQEELGISLGVPPSQRMMEARAMEYENNNDVAKRRILLEETLELRDKVREEKKNMSQMKEEMKQKWEQEKMSPEKKEAVLNAFEEELRKYYAERLPIETMIALRDTNQDE